MIGWQRFTLCDDEDNRVTLTSRIIPFSKSPNWGCSPSKCPKWLINGGLLTSYKSWDDPPSTLKKVVSGYCTIFNRKSTGSMPVHFPACELLVYRDIMHIYLGVSKNNGTPKSTIKEDFPS